MLHGRGPERTHLTELLDGVRAGTARALVIRGDAGIGKSALLESVADDAAATGMRVLRSQGMESESPLAFAGLHQLLRPVLSTIDELPAPQARALRVAFGEQEGSAVDPFVIALATLGMLTHVAESEPVIGVIDDAHWLDAATLDALLFAARRLRDDPVGLVFAVRDSEGVQFVADGLSTMQLTGLDADSGRALLEERLGGDVPDVVGKALLEQTGGNPLALVELPTALSAEQLTGTAPLPGHLQLTDRVQRVFLDRCRRLPEHVQTLLLVAAADDSGNLSVVEQAAGLLGVPTGAVHEAERAHLLVTDGPAIRVRHPLVRSAVYQAATGHERRTAHRALANALAETHDPDRQAWHLAAAADRPDADVAAALERTAQRAERAGGYAAASAAYERAAELTEDGQAKAERLYAAGRMAWSAGQPALAGKLAETAKSLADDRLLRADIDRLRARIEINVGSAATGHHILLAAARSVAADDPVRALEMRVAATLTHIYNTGVPQEDADVERSWTAGDSGLDAAATTRARCLHLLLAATTADEAREWKRALTSLSAALALVAEVDDDDVLANVGNASLHLGHEEGFQRCYERALADARHRGAGMSVLYALPRLGFGDVLAGRWTTLRERAEEALALSADTGQRSLGAAPIAWLTLLAALQGDDAYDGLRARLDEAQTHHLGVMTDPVHDLSRWAAGVHAAHSGDMPGALHHFGRLRSNGMARMAAIDRFDAAVRSDERATAEQWLGELVDFAQQTGWAWALANVAYGRAVLAEPADAAAFFDEALAHHATANHPYDAARTHLAYGELLRRSQHRVDARAHLRTALAVFEELGAEPLAERARQELRASGETARKRDPSTAITLTPAELQVARLVAQGLSNKEVASQLWISPRTVAFHLRGSFAKLGISSRGELTQLDLLAAVP